MKPLTVNRGILLLLTFMTGQKPLLLLGAVWGFSSGAPGMDPSFLAIGTTFSGFLIIGQSTDTVITLVLCHFSSQK